MNGIKPIIFLLTSEIVTKWGRQMMYITCKTVSGDLICCFPLTECTSLISKMVRDDHYRALAGNWNAPTKQALFPSFQEKQRLCPMHFLHLDFLFVWEECKNRRSRLWLYCLLELCSHVLCRYFGSGEVAPLQIPEIRLVWDLKGLWLKSSESVPE